MTHSIDRNLVVAIVMILATVGMLLLIERGAIQSDVQGVVLLIVGFTIMSAFSAVQRYLDNR